jgi:hypothetical protein
VTWLGRGAWPGLAGAGAVLSADRLSLASEALESPHRDTLVAAAIAYRLVGRPSRATTLAGYELELRERAREGNLKAVDVLARAKGLPEDAAVGAVAAWILAQHAAAPDRHTAAMLCEELRDLAVRFPGQAAALPSGRCAEAGGEGDRPGRPVPGVIPALLVLIAPAPIAPAERPGPATAAPPPDKPAPGVAASPGSSGSDVPAALLHARPPTSVRLTDVRPPERERRSIVPGGTRRPGEGPEGRGAVTTTVTS